MSGRKQKLQLVGDAGQTNEERSNPPTSTVRVLSAFPWYDDTYLKNERVDSLLLVARAACLFDDLITSAKEASPDDEGWISYGLGSALGALGCAAGESAIGILLTGLETLIPLEQRAKMAAV